MNNQKLDSSAPANSVAVQFKREASWGAIGLAHYRFGAGQLPEHHNSKHLIALSLSDECSAEVRSASGFRARNGIKGSVCVIPAEHPFAVNFEREAEHLAISLDPSLVFRAAAEAGGFDNLRLTESAVQSDPVINSIAVALLGELEYNNERGSLYADSLAHILALHLVRHYAGANDGLNRFVGGLSGPKLRRVEEFIERNYAQDLSLADLSMVAGMSTFHFAREFKRATGTTPHQYLLQQRIRHAKDLLSNSEMPLVDVGFQSGFSHQSHFTRLFRKLTGTTPQSYRLRFQN
jgi:AraC family transcriptional regulator